MQLYDSIDIVDELDHCRAMYNTLITTCIIQSEDEGIQLIHEIIDTKFKDLIDSISIQ